MNEILIKNHNDRVKPGDRWFFLGDFCFKGSDKIGPILRRLNGNKIFIEGNHDKAKNFVGLVDDFRSDWRGKVGNLSLHLYHYPITSWAWAHSGSVHLHGHSHGHTPSENMLRFDVGVDSPFMRYSPISIEEVESMVKHKMKSLDPDNLDPHREGHHN
jgi:calcineurin-like phosphoesterase family protein